MIARVLALVGGLSGAAGMSQFPEFSQQYTQRLGGAVDELKVIVEQFDQDASGLGLSREAALADLAQGGEIGALRAERMTGVFARYDRLQAALDQLQGAGPFSRAYYAAQLNDADLAKATWEDYKPSVPLTFEGIVFSGAGLIAGFIGVSILLGLLRMVFRRRKSADGIA